MVRKPKRLRSNCRSNKSEIAIRLVGGLSHEPGKVALVVLRAHWAPRIFGWPAAQSVACGCSHRGADLSRTGATDAIARGADRPIGLHHHPGLHPFHLGKA